MVKKRIDERVCRDCGKLIIGRRSDAIVCKDCRRKAQEESVKIAHPSNPCKFVWDL